MTSLPVSVGGIRPAITLCRGLVGNPDCGLRCRKRTSACFEEVFFLGCRFYGVVSAVSDYPEEAELFSRLLVAEIAQPYRFLAWLSHEPGRL